MAFAGGLQQTPRTKWLFSKVVICSNRPIPRSVSVEGATGKGGAGPVCALRY